MTYNYKTMEKTLGEFIEKNIIFVNVIIVHSARRGNYRVTETSNTIPATLLKRSVEKTYGYVHMPDADNDFIEINLVR